jgi:hypothetical protein
MSLIVWGYFSFSYKLHWKGLEMMDEKPMGFLQALMFLALY